METKINKPQAARPATANAASNPASLPSMPPCGPAETNQELVTPVASQRLRDATDAVLNFLSNASNETLGACTIGLCATTYLVLGRIGLVLIGVAGGIVLHATWEASYVQINATDAGRRRRELGVEVVRRALDWRATSKDAVDGEARRSSPADSLPDDKVLGYSDFRPATRAALTALTEA